MITESTDYDDIACLWREGFGDEEDFISTYLRYWQPLGKSFVCRDNSRIVSIADLHKFEGEKGVCNYIYGVVTAKKYRRRGLAASLLKSIFSYLYDNGEYMSMLIAEDNQLADWYLKFGFTKKMPEPVELITQNGFDFGTGYNNLNLPQYRVVNVLLYLSRYAAINPGISFEIAVLDHLLLKNDGFYRVGGGRVERNERISCHNAISVAELFERYPLSEPVYKYIESR